MELPFFQVDAFADRPFAGNQACVIPLDRWLDDATLQAIAAENNVAETAFLVPDDQGADYELRWFTPTVEVALCGHATLASGHVVLSLRPDIDRVRFRTRRAGLLAVAHAPGGYALDLPAWPATPGMVAGLADALGAEPDAVLTRGDDNTVAVFADAAAVRALRPDFRALVALRGGDVLVIATAPGAGDPSGADVISRVFAPGAGIDEDPATGAAHAVIGPYWAERLVRRRFSAFQASARGARIAVAVEGDRVVLGGNCITTIVGVFRL